MLPLSSTQPEPLGDFPHLGPFLESQKPSASPGLPGALATFGSEASLGGFPDEAIITVPPPIAAPVSSSAPHRAALVQEQRDVLQSFAYNHGLFGNCAPPCKTEHSDPVLRRNPSAARIAVETAGCMMCDRSAGAAGTPRVTHRHSFLLAFS